MNPLNSWTSTFVRKWWPIMDLSSVLRWRSHYIELGKENFDKETLFSLNLKTPIRGRVQLRQVSADGDTLIEVALHEVYKKTKDALPRCETLIDLGGNIGLASLYFATHFPSCRLLAVEPDPENYRLLRANLQPLIDQKRAQALNAAVWKEEKSLVLNPPAASDQYNALNFRESMDSEAEIPTVKALPMRKVIDFSGFDRVDLLKVDIEGAEVELFQGDLSWLERVHAIAIEFHQESRVESNFDALMNRYGFRIVENDPHTVIAIRNK